MQEQVISFETAKLAKEKGFDILVDIAYGEDEFGVKKISTNSTFNYSPKKYPYNASTQSLLQKWLREVHKISITVNTHYNISKDTLSYGVTVFKMKHNHFGRTIAEREFTIYEDALERGLFEGLKYVK